MWATWLGWILGAFGVAIAGYALSRLRGTEARLGEETDAREQALCERDESLAQAARKAEEHRRRGEEVAELRRRLDKTRKRSQRAAEEQRTGPERLAALEGELARSSAELDGVRRERDAAQQALEAEQLRARAESGRLEAELHEARGGDAVAASELRAQQALEQAGERTAEAAAAHEKAEAFEKRWKRVDRAYLVLRSEKEALADELRSKNERVARLEALQVALGPEAAGDAAPEESATATPPGVVVAPPPPVDPGAPSGT